MRQTKALVTFKKLAPAGFVPESIYTYIFLGRKKKKKKEIHNFRVCFKRQPAVLMTHLKEKNVKQKCKVCSSHLGLCCGTQWLRDKILAYIETSFVSKCRPSLHLSLSITLCNLGSTTGVQGWLPKLKYMKGLYQMELNHLL